MAWLQRMLETGYVNGQPRQFNALTLEEFYTATKAEVTLIAADTTDSRMLLLNHRTAPGCPVVWAARISMSIPFFWQDVEWRKVWGPYDAWNAEHERLAGDLTSHSAILYGDAVSKRRQDLAMAASSLQATPIKGNVREFDRTGREGGNAIIDIAKLKG